MVSVELSKSSTPPSGGDGPSAGPEVGRFRQGTSVSQWALARYLVGRVIATSLSMYLLVAAVVILALAALVQASTHATFWTVLIAVIGLLVLAFRGAIRWLLVRLTAADHYGPLEYRLRTLVADTRGDILAELRRVGLPGRTWTVPLLALRLARRRRRPQTLERLRSFQVDRAVSAARVDELHHIMRAAFPRTRLGAGDVGAGPR